MIQPLGMIPPLLAVSLMKCPLNYEVLSFSIVFLFVVIVLPVALLAIVVVLIKILGKPRTMDTPPPLTPRDEPSGPTIQMVPSTSSETARSWCIGLHLSGFSGILLGWSLMHIIVPLAIWLIKRADSPEIDATGKEVLNFQISYSLYTGVAILLCFLLIGFAILPVVLITWIVCMVLAAVKVSNGEPYSYPFTIRFLK